MSGTSLWYCLLRCARWLKSFKSVHEIIKSERINESHLAVLSCGIVCYVAQGGLKLGLCMNSAGETIQIKAVAQFFPFFFCYVVRSGPIFGVCECNPKV